VTRGTRRALLNRAVELQRDMIDVPLQVDDDGAMVVLKAPADVNAVAQLVGVPTQHELCVDVVSYHASRTVEVIISRLPSNGLVGNPHVATMEVDANGKLLNVRPEAMACLWTRDLTAKVAELRKPLAELNRVYLALKQLTPDDLVEHDINLAMDGVLYVKRLLGRDWPIVCVDNKTGG